MGKKSITEEDLYVPPFSSHLTVTISFWNPERAQKGWARCWGTGEKCCVTTELFGDHLWKLSCHCLCSEANNSPHHIWKKHLKSWVMACGFFCVAERGNDLSGKVSTALTPTRDKKREILYMLSIPLWKGGKSSDMLLQKSFLVTVCLLILLSRLTPACLPWVLSGHQHGWSLRESLGEAEAVSQDILSIHTIIKKINPIYLQIHNDWDTHLVPGWFHESPKQFGMTLCVLSCRFILRRGWAPWQREDMIPLLPLYISEETLMPAKSMQGKWLQFGHKCSQA